MKTNQVMLRPFYDAHIEQRTKDGYFNATAFLAHFNTVRHLEDKDKKIMGDFLRLDSTKEYIEVIEEDLKHAYSHLKASKSNNINNLKVVYTRRGKNAVTWMNPYLFIDFAMWLSPKFKYRIIKFVYDQLIQFRNDAGDHYLAMCSSLKRRYLALFGTNPPRELYKKEAKTINSLVFGSEYSNQRNEASQEQLNLLVALQLANIRMINQDIKQAERFNRLAMYADMSSPQMSKTNTSIRYQPTYQ